MTILCYHAVDPDWRSPLAIAPDAFEQQCAWLSEHRSVVPLEDALERLDDRGRLPRGTTALTFDDGFEGLHQHALPTLLRYGLPATVFLVAETLTEGGRAVDWVDTPPPWPLKTLSRGQVLEMRDAGIRFGSHSFSHRVLTRLEQEGCREDLYRSREVLEELLDEPVRTLAYPRGAHDRAVREATAAAGFTYGLGLPESPETPGPLAVPRAGMYPGNGTVALRVKTSRRYVELRTSRLFPLARRIAGRAPRAPGGGG